MEGVNAPNNPEAWIVGSGTASLASAVYLVHYAKFSPANVHIFDSHSSMGAALHHNGDSIHGYDQFAGCLPIPVGQPLKELLATIPSETTQNRTVLEEIQKKEQSHMPAKRYHGTRFIIQRSRSRDRVSLNRLGLGAKDRLILALLTLKSEKRLERKRIKDLMPSSFFQSIFWIKWTAQFGFQPWHSAVEFRRALRQYLREVSSLSILNCLDITGYYQYESIFLPIYLYLLNLGVDFHFDTKVTNIDTNIQDGQRRITILSLLENGFQITRNIASNDIVILMVGSTVSGSSTGTEDCPPIYRSIEPTQEFDENWTLWLELLTHEEDFGNPYNFCTRLNESILASFTITTADHSLWEFLASMATNSEAGTFVIFPESHWELNLCIPTQPVFGQQPNNIYVIWGFTLFPQRSGDYIKKPMERCTGAEITTEVLGHLQYTSPVHHTVTIPRLMPRMTSMLLPRSVTDRPEVIPQNTSNIALVGQFVEIPRYSCVDISYGIRTAQVAVSRLTGVTFPSDKTEGKGSKAMDLLKVLLSR